jgi:pimeloyl-ACP methyl ester carboxylesterase
MSGGVREESMTASRTLKLNDGRTLVVYDTGPARGARSGALTIVWHHGSPQTGALLEPLIAASAARGIRLASYARPSYCGSSPNVGRDVASAAADVAELADAVEIDRFAVMGASGGGPHALACAALLSDRVNAAVTFASPAPFVDEYDWYAGMVASDGLRAASEGRDARARYAAVEEFNPNSFTAADWAALRDTWAALGRDAEAAGEAGADGLIDDDVAFTLPWGFDVSAISVPLLVVQGGEDRVIPATHADWLVRNCPTAELWLRPREGHVSVLDAVPVAMDWLLEQNRRQRSG